MSRRYWLGYGALIALGLAVFAASLAIPLLYQHQKHTSYRQEAAAAYQERAANKARDACAGIVGFVDRMNCIARETEANQRDEYSHYDLTAQQNMSLWALGLLIISIEGLLITTAGVVFVAWTLRAAVEANRLNKETLILDQRAWLNVTNVTIDEVFYGGRLMYFKLTLTVTNIGKTPALGVRINTVVTEEGIYETVGVLARQERKDYNHPAQEAPAVILPNDTFLIPSEAAVEVNRLLPEDHMDIVPYLLICITYRILHEDEDELHQTGRIFSVNMKDVDSSVLFLDEKSLRELTPEMLETHLFRGGFAN